MANIMISQLPVAGSLDANATIPVRNIVNWENITQQVLVTDLAGSWTVTSVSVTTANGISGTVATATTTPAITLSLWAITPTTVNWNTFTTGSYTLTGTAGKTLTFTNTLTLAGTDGKGIDVWAATSWKILIGNGTNMVLSTPKFPNASATTRKIIVSDGTDWVASTETYAVPWTSWNVLTSDWTNWTSAAPASAASFWTAITATRVSNTTCTVVWDQTAIFKKGMVLKWKETGTDKMAMVSIPSTFWATTTITFVWDTMAATPDSGTFKYMGMDAFIVNFAVAGTIGSTGTNIANAWYANEPYRVLGADLYTGTAGTTNSTTIDININGTTCFTTKPTLATTVAASTTPFTADSWTSFALNDKITIDIDAVQTTAAVDLYVKLYVIPTRYLFLT